MAEILPMIALSPTMETGKIVSWKKKEGDEIVSGDVICEVETDKATMDYEATTDGTLLKIIAGDGAELAIGQPIAIIGEKGEDFSGLLKEAGGGGDAKAAAPSPAKKKSKEKSEKESEEESEEKAKKESSKEEAEEETEEESKEESEEKAKKESSKEEAEEETEEESEEKAKKESSKEEAEEETEEGSEEESEEKSEEESKEESPAEAKSSQAQAKARPAAPGAKRSSSKPAAPASAMAGEGDNGGRVKVSPLARKMADELGVALEAITGSGPGGRIVKADVEAAAKGGAAASARPAAKTPIVAALEDKAIPLSPKRKIIAKRLSESFYTAPHYFLRVAVQVDGLMAARKAWNDANKDGKISLNALLMKLAAQAITRHPAVNSSWGDGQIIQRGSVDIGLAVAQDDGLITPIVRHCAGKGMLQIEAELRDLIDRALKGKLKPEEYQGATFTISNLGAWGIEEFTAIINPPGAAILAVGAITKEPVAGEGDAIQIQQRMRLTLSCDHRLIDGAVGAAFLKDLKETIEYPIRALM